MNATTRSTRTARGATLTSVLIAMAVALAFVPTASAVNLNSGVPKIIHGPIHHARQFTIFVPPNTATINVRTYGGTGDMGLYLRPPIAGAGWFQSNHAGTPHEQITRHNPQPGIWLVKTRSWQPYNNIIVVATLTPKGPAGPMALGSGQPVGINGPAHQFRYFFIDVPANTDKLIVETRGGVGDMALYVNPPGAGAGWQFVSNHAGTPHEQLRLKHPNPGRWRIRTRSWQPYHNIAVEARCEFKGNATNDAIGIGIGILGKILQDEMNKKKQPNPNGPANAIDEIAPPTPADRVRMRTLTADEPRTGCDGDAAGHRYYRLIVPAGVKRIVFTTTGGKGGCVMLVRREALPDRKQFDYHSAVPGTGQAVAVNKPEAGVYYVRLAGVMDFRDVTLMAEVTRFAATDPAAPAVPADGTTALTSGAAEPVDMPAAGFKRFKITFDKAPARLFFTTRDGKGDCRMYIRRGASATEKDFDWCSTNNGARQTVVLAGNVTAGTYYVALASDGGCQDVKLLVEDPTTVAAK